MADLLAWVVSPTDALPGECSSFVVFARSEGRARVKHARAEGMEPREVAARRESRLDSHAPGPVPASALLAMGWHFECCYCLHEVDEEGCSACWDDAEEVDGEEQPDPVTRGESVWCSESCRAADLREHAERKRLTSTAREAALRVLPSARVGMVWPGTDGSAVVELHVPGCAGRVRYEWPAEILASRVSDHPVLLTTLRRPALETWESEGGAVHG